jgi:ribosome modulation factor
MEYDNTNRGKLGKNNNPKSDKSAPYTGKINVDGKEYWLNGWVNTNKNDGSKFFNLSVKPKEEEQKPAAKSDALSDMDSEIPF